MKTAIINLKGNQYLVKENQEILTNFLNKKPGEKIAPEKILAIYENEKIIASPQSLRKYAVELEVLGPQKGKKLKVFKYKAKSRYRKRKGSKTIFTKLKIKRIYLKNGKS